MSSIVVTAKFKGENSDYYRHGESYLLRVSTDAKNSAVVQQLAEKGEPEGKLEYLAVTESTTKYDSIVTFLYLWEEITSYPTIDNDDIS